MSSWVSNAPPGAVDDDRATTPLDIPQARLDKQVNNAKGYNILVPGYTQDRRDKQVRHGQRKFAIFTAVASFSLSRKIDQTLPLKGQEYVDVHTH